MSDEPTPGQAHVTVPTTTATAELPGDTYGGQPISAVRQAELQSYLDRWQAETDHGDRKGPFDGGPGRFPGQQGIRLSGADVAWLEEHSHSGRDAFELAQNLHLETLYVNPLLPVDTLDVYAHTLPGTQTQAAWEMEAAPDG